MTGPAQAGGKRLSRTERLAEQFKKEKFRKHYFARQLKVFLAAQIRALRGDRTQAQFGELIGKPQSVVARLERESYGKVNLQTLIDIATKLDIALVVRFVSFPTFLDWTKDYSSNALAPQSYARERAENQIKPELLRSLHGEGLTSNTQVSSALFGETAISATSQDLSAQNILERVYERDQKSQQRVIEQAMQECV